MTDDDFEAFFASDLAAEVRREYTDRIDHGVAVADATRDVLALFRDLLSDPQEGPGLFLALAAMQLRDGRVMSVVRSVTLDLIGTGEARRAYGSTDPTISRRRKELLASLEAGLEAARVIDEPAEGEA